MISSIDVVFFYSKFLPLNFDQGCITAVITVATAVITAITVIKLMKMDSNYGNITVHFH